MKDDLPYFVAVPMDEIERLKLKLRSYFRNRISRTDALPMKVCQAGHGYILILRQKKQTDSYMFAHSFDGFDFDAEAGKGLSREELENELTGHVLQRGESPQSQLKYSGDRQIFLSRRLKNGVWKRSKTPLLMSAHPTLTAGVFPFPSGIVVLYYEKIIHNGIDVYKAYLAEFDLKEPEKLLWKTPDSVWDSAVQFPGKKTVPLGACQVNGKIIMYFMVDDSVMYGIALSGFFYDSKRLRRDVTLSKHEENPILTVRPENDWEAFTTLNPAAAYINGQVHILYRAQGFDYISSVGYASSRDGHSIDYRSPVPVYTPKAGFEINNTKKVNPLLMSAGGYGGVEDPRVTVMGDKLYMVYVAFNGWDSVRLALTSISLADFLKQRWNWSRPVLISPPGIIDKSGCLLPEKIGGKYVFFHRVFPNILIDYVDDLNFAGKKLLKGRHSIKIRENKWDSRKIGAGAPPIKTKDGWLLIYYGVDDRDASKYHIGAMLLDLKKPQKVLHRTDKPILSPTEDYENNGFKPGIAYPCGAVVVKGELLVYYGAADSHVCVAKARLDDFLHDLKADATPTLTPLHIKEVEF